jgi:hypothetical protein
MFSDIDIFFSNTLPGSFFILSLSVEEDIMQINSDDQENELTIKEYRFNELKNRVGKERIPSEFTKLNMNTKNLSNVTYEMLNRQIETTLITRNGADKNKIEYKQLFNFIYKDNATIMTIGGIVFDKSQKTLIAKMDFENLPFIKTDKERFKIKCPNLTFREIKALDKLLPDSLEIENGRFKNKKLQEIPLIPTDKKNYSEVYRYYPNYAESVL